MTTGLNKSTLENIMKHTIKHSLQIAQPTLALAYWSNVSAPMFSNDRSSEITSRVREGDGYA